MTLLNITFFRWYPGLVCTVLFSLTGCSNERDHSQNVPELILLDSFTKLITVEDNLLYAPVFLQLDAEGSLYAYDTSAKQIREFNTGDGSLIRSIAGPGRGPGEIVWGNHFRIADYQIHIIDTGRLMIHRYSLSGDFLSSVSYGEMGYLPSSAAPPSPPVNPSVVITPDLNNKPHVMQSGTILLSPVGVNDSTETLYRSYSDDQQLISEIGKLPEGSSLILNNEEVKNDILDHKIPSFFLPKAFPVTWPNNSDKLYIIYSAIPKISLYSASGDLEWEKELTGIAELDSIRTRFFSAMEKMVQADRRSRVPLNYYYSGTVSPAGELWLITHFRDIYIHRFSETGALLNRYKLIAGEETLKPIFDIDFAKQHLYIVNSDGEIQIYPY